MSPDRFRSLVREMEALARRDPRAYRRRVTALAAGALAVPIVVALACLALAFASILGAGIAASRGHEDLPILGLVACAGFVALAVWLAKPFRPPPREPPGTELTAEDSPALFRAIRETAAKVGCPPPDGVYLTGDFNAAVVRGPRVGARGPKHDLYLGLAMMEALPPEEFVGVLAHELGHMTSGHTRIGARICSLRAGWARFAAANEEAGALRGWFAHRFFPYFDACTFVLARAHEYEADAHEVACSSAAGAESSLARAAICTRLLRERFWPEVVRSAIREDLPPTEIQLRIADFLREAIGSPEAERALAKELRMRTGLADTHPCLADRIASIRAGRPVEAGEVPLGILAPARPERTAAETFLGDRLERHRKVLGKLWRAANVTAWREMHARHGEARKGIEKLEAALAAGGEPTPDEARALAGMRCSLAAPDVAREILEAFVREHPEDAEARRTLGRVLLEDEDDRGIEELETAMRLERDLTLPACEEIRAYLHRMGREEESIAYERRAHEELHLLREDAGERRRLRRGDRLAPHGQSEERVREIAGELEGCARVKRAWLVRKSTRHRGDKPCLVLVVQLSGAISGDETAYRAWLANRLRRALDFDGIVHFPRLGGRRFAAVPDALVFERASSAKRVG